MQVSYDSIGAYNQDAVNGFSKSFIDEFIDYCDLSDGQEILDAMGGDGNLSLSMLDRYEKLNITLADISKVQTDIARQRMGHKMNVVNIDFVNDSRFENQFDRVIIKSATHEIPKMDQQKLYKNIYKALKPGGKYINLGILIDCEENRYDINRLNEYRSKLAGVPQDVQNRYFLLRDEYYLLLKESGFGKLKKAREFHYSIDMGILVREYMKDNPFSLIQMNGLVTELHSLRKNHYAVLDKNWIVKMPGEITIAQKEMDN